MLLQRVKGSQESCSKQKSHSFSLAASLPGVKKKVCFFFPLASEIDKGCERSPFFYVTSI